MGEFRGSDGFCVVGGVSSKGPHRSIAEGHGVGKGFSREFLACGLVLHRRFFCLQFRGEVAPVLGDELIGDGDFEFFCPKDEGGLFENRLGISSNRILSLWEFVQCCIIKNSIICQDIGF